MAQYLRSQTTGVVLPYNEKLRKRLNIELMTPEECVAYEASIKSSADPHPDVVVPTVTVEPTPTPAVETLPDEDEVVSEQPVVEATVEVADVSEGEPSAAELLASLEGD